MSACLQRSKRRSQRVNLSNLRERDRPRPEGHGPRWTVLSAAGSSAGRLGEGSASSACGPERPLDGVVPAGLRADRRRPGLPARHPHQGRGCPAARLCRGTGPAVPPPSAAVGDTDQMPGLPAPSSALRPPLVRAARSRAADPRPGPGGLRRRPPAPRDSRGSAAPASGRWQ
jgi:hypothetical protein